MKKKIHIFYKNGSLWLVAMAAILTVWVLVFVVSLPDGKLRLVFCDVGQGDGIYIDLPDGSDVLIDGGPNRKVLECLGENMPFWERKLEMVVLTHPQKDHLEGLIEVVKRYEIDWFVTGPIGNNTRGYQKLVEEIREKGVKVKNVYAGDVIGIGGAQFRVLWPSRQFVASNMDMDKGSSKSFLGEIRNAGSEGEVFLERETNVLGAQTAHADLNDFSIVTELEFGEFEALLGGDADEEIQDDIMKASEVRPVEVFKVPHHGSKYGILAEYLEKAAPKFAVVSVGKNRWGHPSAGIIDRLKAIDAKVYRTDKNGAVKFTTDGKQIWVKSDRK